MLRVAYMLLITAFALVGIAMGSHGLSASGHTAMGAASVTTITGDPTTGHKHAGDRIGADTIGVDTTVAADCATCAFDPRSAQLIACAFLALMVVTVLLLPRLAVVVLQPAAVLRDAAMRLSDLAPAPRPPDLLALGISRR